MARDRTRTVQGTVINPANDSRTFSPLLRCVEDDPMRALAPGEYVSSSLTLLRGAQGALFPMPGQHRVRVEVSWDNQGVKATVIGEASIMVTQNAEHAAAAAHVLATPDTLLTLVLGGDHLKEGIEAVQTALRDEVLRPHFAYIEAKRLGQRFHQRPPQTEAVAALLGDGVVTNQLERAKADSLLSADAAQEPPARKREPRRTGNNGDGKGLQDSP